MSTSSNLSFERLKGRENFSEWKVGARAYLISKGHWTHITTELGEDATPKDKLADQKALAELTLLLDPGLYSHIDEYEEAKKAWDALKNVFEDKGALRKVSLFKQWISLQLGECSSMQEYVNKSVTLRNKVKSAGFEISEDIAGSILLCGLSEEYKPLIMSMEVKEKLTMDYVKNLLLQSIDFGENSESALSVQNKRKSNNTKKAKKPVKCYDCGGPHYKNKCPNKSKNKSEQSECVFFSNFSTDNREQNNENHEIVLNNDFNLKHELNVAENVVLYSALTTKKSNDNNWYVDSGATRHMTYMDLNLENLRKPMVKEVKVANNATMKINQVGDLRCKIGEQSNNVTLGEVHHIPDLCVNLLSVSQIVKRDNTVVFDKNGVRIYGKDKNVLIASGNLIDGMFKLNIQVNEFAGACNDIKNDDDSILWHRRLAHTNFTTLKSVLNIKMKPDTKCIVCAQGKHQRNPFNDSGTRASKPLELIHSDVCGPMSVRSLGNYRYFVTFIDDFSRKVFVYALKSKGEVFSKFVEFKARAENETEYKIKNFRSDNGTEYENKNFQEFFAKHGIKHEKSAPYSPQQNGLSERMNRTIIEKVRCMLLDAGLSKQFWAEAVFAAVNIINVIPNASSKTAPNEIWHSRKCNLKNFRVFGCKAMVWQPEQKRTKLDAKSYPCIFLRYADNAKAYRLYDMSTKKIVTSRDVIFLENNNEITNSADSVNSRKDFVTINDGNDSDSNDSLEVIDENIASGGNIASEPIVTQSNEMNVSNTSTNEFHDAAESTTENENVLTDTMLDDSAMDDSSLDPSFRTRARTTENARRPNTRSTQEEELLLGLLAFMVSEPLNYKQALIDKNSERWKIAMQEEYNSLVKNNTWDLVERPSNVVIVDNKWVYKVKDEQNNSPSIFKARLVARGFTQEYGINYYETFSPVVRFTSIRIILAIAAQKKMSIRQFDVKTAFLNGDLKENVYMEQPVGFTDGSQRVCKLKKSLYGLKQSSRCWNEKFSKFIKLFGFFQCKSDSCVFVSRQNKKLTILAIHVDDGIIVGEDLNDKKRCHQISW